MKTNIDYLHKVNIYSSARNCGKTFALCHQAVGLLEVGFNKVLFTVKHLNRWKFIRKMLLDVIEDHEIKDVFINESKMEIITELGSIQIISEHQRYWTLFGLVDYALVDDHDIEKKNGDNG